MTKYQKIYEKQQAQSPRQTFESEQSKISSDSNENPKPIIQKDITSNVYSGNISDNNVSGSNEHTGIRLKVESERISKYRLRSHLHGKLHNCTTDEERFEIAKQLIELQPELDKLNQELDALNNGVIPVEYVTKNSSAEDYVRIKNLKMYIARYERKISTATNIQQKQNWQSKIEEFKTELRLLI